MFATQSREIWDCPARLSASVSSPAHHVSDEARYDQLEQPSEEINASAWHVEPDRQLLPRPGLDAPFPLASRSSSRQPSLARAPRQPLSAADPSRRTPT